MLTTDRLTIRPIEAVDWPAVREIWRDFAASPFAQYDKPHVTDPENVRARIARGPRLPARVRSTCFSSSAGRVE
jgi:L-amino acid N-acyltransferase YncA